MQVGSGSHVYSWNSRWAKIPPHITPGYTHGVGVDRRGRVFVFNQSAHAILTFDGDGNFLGTWGGFPSARFLGAHGLTLVNEGDQQFLWLTDQNSAEVVKTTLDGQTVLSIPRPDHPAYRSNPKYSPTWADQGPDGTIYVADGYGQGYVNLYDNSGKYLDCIDGSRGAGRFNCPHGLAILNRPQATGQTESALYITDRGNSRVQVFALDGRFIKSFNQAHPCCFAQHSSGDLLVPDLKAFVALYDAADSPVLESLGSQPQIVGQHGWPNVPHSMRVDGKFNSPHGGAFDAAGNIYIVEWINDGRITKLTRIA